MRWNWLVACVVGAPIAGAWAVDDRKDQSGGREDATENTAPAASSPPNPAMTAVGEHQDDVIIVTADRRDIPLWRYPASADVLTGEALQDAGAIEMRDFLRQIPGVGMTEIQPDLQRIPIRGIEADVTAVTTQTTGVFIDDVPFNDPLFNQIRPDLPLFDIDAVEVLKGPQGTLFGGSALAGAIRYRLKDAVPGVWETSGFAEADDVQHGDVSRSMGAAVNIPVWKEEVALRLVGTRRLVGGTINDLNSGENDTDNGDSYSFRGIARWDVSGDTTLRARAMKQKSEYADLPYAENDDGRLERSRTLGESPLMNEFELYGFEARHRMPWATFVSNTNYVKKYGESTNAGGELLFGIEGTPISFPQQADVEGVTHEFRLVSPDNENSPWIWLGGLYFNRYEGDTKQQIIFAETDTDPRQNNGSFDFDVTAEEWAAFGEATRRLSPRWSLTLGIRAYRTETEGRTQGSGPFITGDDSVAVLNDADTDSTGVNPKVALQFDVTERLFGYASIARGFRLGGIQIIGPSEANPTSPSTFDPDSVWTYELGLKGRWPNRGLQASAAVFYVDWNDPQVQTTTGGDVPINVIDNVGGARSIGAELSIRYRPSNFGPDLSLSAGYTGAETTEDYADPTGNTVSSGTQLPGSSDVQVSAEAGYRWGWGNAEWWTSVRHNYHGKGYSDIQHSAEILDFHTTDLHLSVGSEGTRYRPKIGLSLLNLADEQAVVTALALAPDAVYYVYNRPRTILARLSLDF